MSRTLYEVVFSDLIPLNDIVDNELPLKDNQDVKRAKVVAISLEQVGNHEVHGEAVKKGILLGVILWVAVSYGQVIVKFIRNM